MGSRNIIAMLLLIAYASIAVGEEFIEGYYNVNEDWDIDEESVIDYIAVNSEQEENLQWTHFFNGSYSVMEIMSELASNRSLLPEIDRSTYNNRGDSCYFSRIYGGRGGRFFRDPCSFNNLGGLIIRAGDLVNSIQSVYTNNKNQQWVPYQHGGNGGSKNMVMFYEEEYIIAMVGSYGSSSRCSNCINELGFLTENKYGLVSIHGPYGKKNGNILILAGEIGGFFGRSGNYLDAIGCYYRSN